MTAYGLAIFDQHAAMLAASSVTPEHARARGYVSVDTKVRLGGLGVTKAGRNVPGLLVPMRDKAGQVWGYQYRPDRPRSNGAGKPVKYETPTGQRNGIDVPPGVGPALDDPTVPLWITEGARKADSAACAGLACVALPGVWSWIGTNGRGGKTAVADWHDMALNGRPVVLAFDSDVVRKRSVRRALDELAGYLSAKGATVRYLHLPHDDAKTGLDDYLGAGHTVEELHALVRPEAPEVVEVELPTVEAVPVVTAAPFTGSGADLLDDVHGFLRAYVAFPSDAASVGVALWAAHTHLVESFESTPRLALLSPEKQCGKSRTLELLELLCAGAETLSDASAAYLFRRIGAGAVSVLLDEADAIWKRGKADETAEALRSIVNAGHRKSATVGRVEMKAQGAELRRFRVYAPVAVAGIGNCLPDTILDRAVVVPMRRRAPDEPLEEYRERTTRPEGQALRDRLAAWAATVADKVGCPWPDMPPGVTDRPADVWEPLLAVADAAGGHWPERGRAACVTFVTGARDDVASVGTRLLADLLDVFRDGADVVPALPTEHILRQLLKLDEAPWGDWYGKPLDARGLARLLKPYGVKSGTVRIGDETAKGYRRADLWDPWTRYGVLAGVSDTSVTSVTPLASTVTHVTDVTDKGPEADDRPATLLDTAPGTTSCRRCGRRHDGPSLCPACLADLHAQAKERTA